MDDYIVLPVPGPDRDLVAVGIHRRRRMHHCRIHEHTHCLVGVVTDLMCTGWASWKADHVPWTELVGAGWMTGCRPARKHNQPLFLGVLVVVGTDRLTWRKLINGRPHLLGTEQGTKP